MQHAVPSIENSNNRVLITHVISQDVSSTTHIEENFISLSIVVHVFLGKQASPLIDLL